MIAPVSLPDAFQMGTLNVPRRAPPPPMLELATPSISFGNACAVKRCPVPCETVVREFSGSLVPVLYLHFALFLGFGALFLPEHMPNLLLILTPLWLVCVLVHAVSKSLLGFLVGLVLCLLYPPLAMFPRDAGLQAFYFLFFGAFATGPFHREQRGLSLIACCAAWVGLVASVCWLLSQDNARGSLTACCASALLLALVGSRRLGRFQFKVVRPEQTT
jgi:hypothetical protein